MPKVKVKTPKISIERLKLALAPKHYHVFHLRGKEHLSIYNFCRWPTCQTFNFLISRSTRWVVHPKISKSGVQIICFRSPAFQRRASTSWPLSTSTWMRIRWRKNLCSVFSSSRLPLQIIEKKVETLGNSLHKCRQLKVYLSQSQFPIYCLQNNKWHLGGVINANHLMIIIPRYFVCKTTAFPSTQSPRLFLQRVRFSSFH